MAFTLLLDVITLVFIQHIFPPFTETQDDLEAITTEIKKMANNARNKLKSESCTSANLRGSCGIFNTGSKVYHKMMNDGSSVIPKSLISAIERNLESEEQERVSADMRIRKSQVNYVLCVCSQCHPQPGWSCFDIVVTFSEVKSFFSAPVLACCAVQEVCGGHD